MLDSAININGLKELKAVFTKGSTNIDKISYFFEKYGYDETSNNTEVLLDGFEYYGHWSDKNDSILNLNDYLVDYELVLDGLRDKGIATNFKNEEYYSKLFKEFESNLLNIGVEIGVDDCEGYDSLMVYSLPTVKLLDENFINSFTTLVSDYKSNYEQELECLYN